jgi:hypothetical protein
MLLLHFQPIFDIFQKTSRIRVDLNMANINANTASKAIQSVLTRLMPELKLKD